MSDQPKMGSVEWLRKNALFGCFNCSEDYSWRAEHLRVVPDNGDLVCENCYCDLDRMPGDEDQEDAKGWSDLPAFDPFARLEEAERLLREVVESGGHGMPVGLWGEIRVWADPVPIEVEKPS